jgi:hypothetical protein
MSVWKVKFERDLEGLSYQQLSDIANYCYKKADSQSGPRYTNGIERDIWKEKAVIAFKKRNSLR